MIRLGNGPAPVYHLLYLFKLGQASQSSQLLPWHPTQRETHSGWEGGCCRVGPQAVHSDRAHAANTGPEPS